MEKFKSMEKLTIVFVVIFLFSIFGGIFLLSSIVSGKGSNTDKINSVNEEESKLKGVLSATTTPKAIVIPPQDNYTVSSPKATQKKSATPTPTTSPTASPSPSPTPTASPTPTSTATPVSVSCSVSKDTSEVNQDVTWTAAASNGDGNYSYTWEGEKLDGKTDFSVTVKYDSAGSKSGKVKVKSNSQESTCEKTITITPTP